MWGWSATRAPGSSLVVACDLPGPGPRSPTTPSPYARRPPRRGPSRGCHVHCRRRSGAHRGRQGAEGRGLRLLRLPRHTSKRCAALVHVVDTATLRSRAVAPADDEGSTLSRRELKEGDGGLVRTGPSGLAWANKGGHALYCGLFMILAGGRRGPAQPLGDPGFSRRPWPGSGLRELMFAMAELVIGGAVRSALPRGCPGTYRDPATSRRTGPRRLRGAGHGGGALAAGGEKPER